MVARLSILLTFVSLATADQEAISHGQNDDDIGDFSLSSGCDLQYHVANVTVCHQGAVCYAPLHSTVVLLCPNEDGKWLHNSTILDNITSSNLTLTDLHYNDSGRYLYDIKEHCEYLLSVGEPPTVTAPKLNCHEGCCSLPITTVTTDSNDVYLICNTTDPQDTILWCNGDTPAKGTNNEERYKLPYYHGKAGTIVHLTCFVTNHYGNATLTYNVVVKEAPSDDLSKYKEAIGLNKSRNYTEGSVVHLPFAIYQHESSLAKFCHFPNNTYKLLYGFLEFNHSTCCVCVLDDCTKCGNMNFTVSSIADWVRSSYNYTIHLSDVTKEDFGLYTLLACVYQVNTQSCGTHAWTEVQVRPSRGDEKVFLMYIEIGVPSVVGVIITAFIAMPFCCWCCWCCYVKVCCQKRKRSDSTSSSQQPLLSPVDEEASSGNADNDQGSDTSSTITSTANDEAAAAIVSNSNEMISDQTMPAPIPNNKVNMLPKHSTPILPKKKSSDLLIKTPVSATGTPNSSMDRLPYRDQPIQEVSNKGDGNLETTATTDSHHDQTMSTPIPNDKENVLSKQSMPTLLGKSSIVVTTMGAPNNSDIVEDMDRLPYRDQRVQALSRQGDGILEATAMTDSHQLQGFQNSPPNTAVGHEKDSKTGADNRSQPTDNETVLIASQVSKTFEHIETYSDEWIETTLGDVNKKKLQERSKHTSSSSEPNNVCGGRDDCLPGSDINETGSLNKQNGDIDTVIVYCEADYHKTNDQDHPALELSNFLRDCGVDCVVDLHYSTDRINDWSLWMEQNIRNCNGHIILLCGKKLHESLQEVNNERIQMNVAHIGAQALRHLIDDSQTNTYFVPVFFGEELVDYIPTALKGRSHFTIRYDAVMEDYDDVDDVLNNEENKSLCSLVAKLTRQQEHYMPPVNDTTYNSTRSDDHSSMPNGEQFVIHDQNL